MTDDQQFIATVKEYYKLHARDLPWRHPIDNEQFAYYVFVSEMMLQQTQVSRVIDKFNIWIKRFPTIKDVADATLLDVMEQWQGLGYNRRARYLYESAKAIINQHNGIIPNNIHLLTLLPGVGHNTAAAIVAYAYNQPTIFIETNIRSVYLYHYFNNVSDVSDKNILNKVKATLDTKHPREWYWALMDYGTYIKKQKLVSLSKSKVYKKQPAFSGSRRQLRGIIVASLVKAPKSLAHLKVIVNNDDRLMDVVAALENEQIIVKNRHKYQIAV